LIELKSQLENGIDDITSSTQKKVDRYFINNKKGRAGKLKIAFNDAAIIEAKKYFGYFTLVSNHAMNSFEALENYRLREKIEELFSTQKGRLDGARPRTWYPENLRGRQFTQFVALGYHCFLSKKIKEVRALLGHEQEGKTKSTLVLEKKLDSWLAQRSLSQILDWFDCIETTVIRTPMGVHRWSTESIARDKLFLKYLGVTKE